MESFLCHTYRILSLSPLPYLLKCPIIPFYFPFFLRVLLILAKLHQASHQHQLYYT